VYAAAYTVLYVELTVRRTSTHVRQGVRTPLLSAQESVHARKIVNAPEDTVTVKYVDVTVGRTEMHVLQGVRRPPLSAMERALVGLGNRTS